MQLIIFVFFLCEAGSLHAEAVFRSPGEHSNDSSLRQTQSLLQNHALEFAKTLKGSGAQAVVRFFNALQAPNFEISLSETSVNRIQFELKPLRKSGEVEWQVSMLRLGLAIPDLLPQNAPMPVNGYLQATLEENGLTAGA